MPNPEFSKKIQRRKFFVVEESAAIISSTPAKIFRSSRWFGRAMNSTVPAGLLVIIQLFDSCLRYFFSEVRRGAKKLLSCVTTCAAR